MTNAAINGGSMKGSGTMTLVAGGNSTIGANCPTTSLTLSITVPQHAAVGTDTITVTNPDGGSAKRTNLFDGHSRAHPDRNEPVHRCPR